MNTAVSALVLIVFGLAGFGRLAEFVKDWKFAIGIVHYAPEISKAGESIVDGSTIFEPNKGLDNAETSILGTPLSGVEPETEPMPEEQAPIAQGNSTLDHGKRLYELGETLTNVRRPLTTDALYQS